MKSRTRGYVVNRTELCKGDVVPLQQQRPGSPTPLIPPTQRDIREGTRRPQRNKVRLNNRVEGKPQSKKLAAYSAGEAVRLWERTIFRTGHYKSIRGSSRRLGIVLGGGRLLNANKGEGGRQIERVQDKSEKWEIPNISL